MNPFAGVWARDPRGGYSSVSHGSRTAVQFGDCTSAECSIMQKDCYEELYPSPVGPFICLFRLELLP